MGENKELYKDKNEVKNETQYSSEAENFWDNIEKGIVLRECLNIPKELVENKSGQNGWKHIECKPELSENEEKYKNDDESRLCRCFHFRNVSNNSGCKREKCVIGYYEKNYILNNCNVLDHEVRTEYKTSGIGKFDLILEYENTNYAVEVKPSNNIVGNYKIITFCGSTRFKNEFIEAQKRLTLEGDIVISAGLFGHCRYTIHLDNFLNFVKYTIF